MYRALVASVLLILWQCGTKDREAYAFTALSYRCPDIQTSIASYYAVGGESRLFKCVGAGYSDRACIAGAMEPTFGAFRKPSAI